MSGFSEGMDPSFTGGSGDLFWPGIIHEIPVPAAMYRGKDFILELANEEMLRLLGRDSRAIGRKLIEVVPELKGQPYFNLLSESYTSGQRLGRKESLTYLEKSGDLQPVYVNLIYKPLRDGSGMVSGILAIAYDVTELVQARNRIREVEERSLLAIDSAQLGTFDINFLTGENTFSQRFRDIFGFTEETITQQQVAAAIHPEDLHISDHGNQNILEGGLINYDVRIIRRDGTIRWINTVGRLFQDENKNPIRLIGAIRDISQHKAAEEKIAIMAAIVESSNDAIISKTLDSIVTSWNEAAERIYGYSAKEMIGRDLRQLIPPDCQEEDARILERLKKGETIEHFETRRITKDKRIIDISLTVSPVKDLRGNVVGISKISRDITAHKKVERHIFESEERLHMLISAGELGTWEVNIGSDEVEISEKTRRILGYGLQEQLSRQHLTQLVHPDDLHIRNRAFAKAPVKGSLDAEFRIISRDGKIRWVNLQGKVLYDNDNEPSKIIGTIRDITNKILAVEELRESEQKFRLLANAMPQLIWTSDDLGRLDYFNQSFEIYSGMNLAEVAKGGWLQLVHPDDRQESVDLWSEAVKRGEAFIFEHRFRKYNGEYRWHLSRALPQKNSMGEIQMWVGTSTDIHEQKTFAQELEKKVKERTRDLEEANRGLEKMNQELASFAYVSSHDLQEPLRKIQTFAMHILEKEQSNLSATGKDYFNRMQKAANRMQNLIEDLLTYSRTNTSEKVFEHTDLNHILAEAKGELDRLILEKKASIVSDKLPAADIIPYQFRQFFINLLSNSLKFTRKDVAPAIRICWRLIPGTQTNIRLANPLQQYYHISVTDNGIGFDEEFNEKIFEVFQRLHGRSEYEGTGIGLAIAKKIIENHNGFIDAVGNSGQGAVFNVYIPEKQA